MSRPFYDRRLGILKGGQLGRMLLQAAVRYDLYTAVLDPDQSAPCRTYCDDFVRGDPDDFQQLVDFGRRLDLVTVEFEHVNAEALDALVAEGVSVRPDPAILRMVQDKGTQKEFYRAHGVPTADFVLVEGKKEILARPELLPAVQKTRRAGYDGKGVVKLRQPADLATAFDEPSVVERWVDHDKEIAVLVARSAAGEVASYPVVEMTLHPERNLVEMLQAPADLPEPVERRAVEVAVGLARSLDLVGVLAVEMFVGRDGEVLVNEIAPRPHNSGHHTIEANVTSQYDQHLRAILDLPLGSTAMRSPAVMVNLLGEPGHWGPVRYAGVEDVLRMEDVHLHIYGKALTSPFRKMGHATVLDRDLARARERARRIGEVLRVVT